MASGRQADGPPGTQQVPVEVQAVEFSTEPPNSVSALWGVAGKSAEAAATWGDEVKW